MPSGCVFAIQESYLLINCTDFVLNQDFTNHSIIAFQAALLFLMSVSGVLILGCVLGYLHFMCKKYLLTQFITPFAGLILIIMGIGNVPLIFTNLGPSPQGVSATIICYSILYYVIANDRKRYVAYLIISLLINVFASDGVILITTSMAMMSINMLIYNGSDLKLQVVMILFKILIDISVMTMGYVSNNIWYSVIANVCFLINATELILISCSLNIPTVMKPLLILVPSGILFLAL